MKLFSCVVPLKKFEYCTRGVNSFNSMSTVKCERSFRAMNVIIKDFPKSFNDRTYIKLSGLEVENFKPISYIKLWLNNHYSVTKPTTPR